MIHVSACGSLDVIGKTDADINPKYLDEPCEIAKSRVQVGCG